MAEKVVVVRIDGVDGLSQPAKKAGDGMDALAGKKDGWIKSFVDVKAAMEVVGTALRAVWGFAQESLGAFDEYEASMRKIEGTAKITGTPLGVLTELATAAKKEFGLSSVQANDYATAVNNLATKAGFAGDKQKLLASMLDLGAAKGLTAAQSLQAFEQSILGIDEGTDKLFGKNPSGLWADYADQIGKAPGKMSDLDKSMVLVYATMEAGGMVQGSYSEWLDSAQGQQSLLTNRLQNGKVAFGEMLSPVRALVVQGINTFIDSLGEGKESLAQLGEALMLIAKSVIGAALTAWQTFGPAVVGILKVVVVSVMFLTDMVQLMAIVTQKAVGLQVQWFGYLVEKGGRILSAFGVEVVEGWGKAMREWGEKTSRAATESFGTFREEGKATWELISSGAKTTTPEVTRALDTMGESGRNNMRGVKDETDAAKESAKQYAKMVQDETKKNDAAIKVLNESYKFLRQSMDLLDASAAKALKPERAQAFTTGMEGIRKATDHTVSSLMATLPPVDSLVPKVSKVEQVAKQIGGVIVENARGVLDLAGAFGVADEEAQVLIGSAINLAQALPKALAGDFSSIGGVLAASANIMKQITGGDAARQKLLRENTTGLDRLRHEVGNLKLNITGDTFTGVKGALAKIVPALKDFTGKNLAFNASTLISGLQASGITLQDLEEVGKALGISLRDSKGALQLAALPQLLEALGLTEFGQFGSGFSDRLESTTRGFDINNVGAADQIRQLFGVGASFSPALQGVFDASDLAGTRGRLAGLFAQLQAGTLDASQFGGLTGTQFLDLITDLIGRIDDLAEAPPSTPPASAPPPATDPLLPVDPSGPAGRAADLLSVFREYTEAATPWMARMDTLTAQVVENTGLTVDELRQVNAWLEIMSGGVGIDLIDAALAERRRLAEASAGGSPSP